MANEFYKGEPWKQDSVIQHTQMYLDSFERWRGYSLCDRDCDINEQAKALFFSSFAAASHGIESDPVFNFANLKTLELWETDQHTFLKTPSRKSAETVHRDERKKLLERVSQFGFIDNYQGIRISFKGKRFQISNAVVWNLYDDEEIFRGQAVMFSSWVFI